MILFLGKEDQDSTPHGMIQEALFKTKCTMKEVYICDFIFPDTIVNMDLFPKHKNVKRVIKQKSK